MTKHPGVELRMKKKDRQKLIKGWLEYGREQYAKKQHGREKAGKADHPDA